MAEDVGFHANEFTALLGTFVNVFCGSDAFFEKCTKLAQKFKYALSDDDVVLFIDSFVKSKRAPPSEFLKLLPTVTRDSLTTPSVQHTFDYLISIYKVETH